MTDAKVIPDAEYKAAVRREWTRAAPGWERWIDITEAPGAGRTITDVLLARADLQEGDAVLDIGCGYGEPGLHAASAVGPHGHVTCIDISGDMLAFAERRARAAGVTNVDFVEADIEHHRLEPGAFDVVLSRAALMYASNPRAVLRHLHTSLRPGGHFAAAVWATPERVAFAAPVAVMVEMGVIDPPPPGPGPFALGADGQLAQLVRDAGLTEVTTGTVVATYELPSVEACTTWLRDVAPPITEMIAHHPEPLQDEVWGRVTDAWRSFSDSAGTVSLPCTAVWASGRAPA